MPRACRGVQCLLWYGSKPFEGSKPETENPLQLRSDTNQVVQLFMDTQVSLLLDRSQPTILL
jgi:hypothetical protein